jgi:predicted transcriptional regulator YheO
MGDERAAIIAAMANLVDELGQALGPRTEVVLHDLSRLPNSIVAIANPVTGRTVGDPPTDLLLADLRGRRGEGRYRYAGTTAGGRRLRSSTMFVRDGAGEPIAALCVNQDVTAVERLRAALDDELDGVAAAAAVPAAAPALGPEPEPERFAHGVEELASVIVERAIAGVGVPVESMKKHHKLEVVRELERRGFFLLRDGIELAAGALGVTRYTIYNYLNEIGAGGQAQAQASGVRIR